MNNLKNQEKQNDKAIMERQIQRELNPSIERTDVFAHGYNVVPRQIFLDKKLSVEAKLLYAYFCIVSGCSGGYQLCPSERLILDTLNISHTRYLRHRKALIKAGYIGFKQRRECRSDGRQLYSGTSFILNELPNVPSHLSISMLATAKKGVWEHGYGIVPRLPLFNHSISIEAKAAYVFMCIHAESNVSGDRDCLVTCAKLEEKLMGRKRVYRAMNELKKANYIARKTENYVLNYELNLHSQCTVAHCEKPTEDKYVLTRKKQIVTTERVGNNTTENVQNDTTIRSNDNVDFVRSVSSKNARDNSIKSSYNNMNCSGIYRGRNDTVKNDTAKNDTALYNSNMSYNNSSLIINQSINNTRARARRVTTESNNQECWKNLPDIRYVRKVTTPCLEQNISIVHNQIEAHILKDEFAKDLIDCIVLEMATIYSTPGIDIVKANGHLIPAGDLAVIYKRLKFAHVEYMLQTLRENAPDPRSIQNVQAYLRSCLYNASIAYSFNEMLILNA